MKQSGLSNRQLMNRIYRDICGFEIPKEDEAKVRESKGSPVYGEIKYQALSSLLANLHLSASDVFFDLGSGVGKVILYTALFTPVKKAVGIELSQTRHEHAQQALSNAKTLTNNSLGRCQLINGDLMTADLSAATIIYTCSTAFSLAFMRKVTARLRDFDHHYRLVTLQELPTNGPFRLVDKIPLDMSWVRKTPVYIYER